MLVTVDAAAGNKTQLLRIALKSFKEVTAILDSPAAEDDGFAPIESLGLAYLALGTILDARRDMMVFSLSGRRGSLRPKE
jgi:hypothetical protein